ncbi:hypothetical protein GGH95_001230 [Coemansia sp. RSA 1836]|nr:hypothetical protein GGH95_001230 [Coemansia sp. RSA 1836]
MPHAKRLFDIKFSAETKRRGRVSESQLPHSTSLLEFGSDYFDFVLPRPIEITDSFEDVVLRCEYSSLEWKTGVILCSVRLVLVEATTEGRARTQANSSSLDTTRLTGRQRKFMSYLRLKNVRSTPGASYRPWRPWTTFQWYEVASIGIACILIAAVLVQLFIDKTRK